MEEWRLVLHGWYAVSSKGRVRRETGGQHGAQAGKILRQYVNRNGYLYVRPCIGGVSKTVFVHKLIAMAWLGKRPKGKEVNHKNGKKKDNRPSNLEYATRQKNLQHATRHGKLKNVKLTAAQIRRIRKLAGRHTKEVLARKFAVTPDNIYRILTKRSWGWLK